eukprot:Opistho-2@64417
MAHEQKENARRSHPDPLHLWKWIESVKADLKPPVGNKMLYGKDCEFKIMIVGGPNTRTDYHVQNGEEFFWQLQGNMVLRINDGGMFKDIAINEGECFMLPPNIPHSPQRTADSIGLVIERERLPHEIDHLRWYCPNCRRILYQESFHCIDLGSELVPVINRYYDNEPLRMCKNCGHVDERNSHIQNGAKQDADPTVPRVNWETHPLPFSLNEWIDKNKGDLKPPVGNKMVFGKHCEFKVMIVGGPNTRTDYHEEVGEEWFYMIKGDMTLKIKEGGKSKDVHIREGESYLLPGNVPHSPQRFPDTIGLVVERERRPHEVDFLRWYCRSCGEATVFEDSFHCTDLGAQLKPVIEKYYGDESLRRCPKCGITDQPPH